MTDVALIHAGVADSRMWEPQVSSFAPSHRVIAPDLPGFGQTPLDQDPVDLRAFVRDALDAAGMQTEAFGGLGDIPYRDLHRRVADYRFLFSPMRYTSLPLAVVEAMTIGMPVVALATTELPTVIEHGVSGYVSCDVDELVEQMRTLLDDAGKARRIGANARALARERFGLDRFIRDWNEVFRSVAQ